MENEHISNEYVTHAELPQGSATGRVENILRLCSNGMMVNYDGHIFIYMEPYCDWRNVASQEAMVYILSMMGITNVPLCMTCI